MCDCSVLDTTKGAVILRLTVWRKPHRQEDCIVLCKGLNDLAQLHISQQIPVLGQLPRCQIPAIASPQSHWSSSSEAQLQSCAALQRKKCSMEGQRMSCDQQGA